MSGAQTTLSLQDRLTGPLMKIIKAMDSTIRVMEQMDSATQQLDQKSLANARRNISNASADMERLRASVDKLGTQTEHTSRQQEKFNNSLGNGLSKIKSLAAGVLAAVGAFKLLGAAKNVVSDMLSRGINFHAFKQGAEVAFTTFLGDAQKAKQYMDDMYAFALKTPFAYPDLLESSRNMIAFGISAENTFPIMRAIGDAVAAVGGGNAEMQNMADIFGQIQAQGRITAEEVNRLSLYGINGFEMLAQAAGTTSNEMRKQVSKGAIDAGTAIEALVTGIDKKFGGMMEGLKGGWAGAIDSMNSARRNAGAAMTKDLMRENGPLVTAVQTITGLYKKVPQYIGPAVAAFEPLINMFNQTFGGNRFDGIFAALGASITFVATMFSWMGQAALEVADVIANNWSWIAPILTVIGSILMAIVATITVVQVATMIWAAYQWIVNSAYLANPITWVLLAIVAVIALVIYAMIAWSETTANVIGAVVGSVYWLGAVFYNTLIGIGNIGIIVAEMFVNTWNLAIFGVQMLWIGLNVLVRAVFDAIGNIALQKAEFFMNTWNRGVYGVQLAFYKMGDAVLSIMSGVGSGVVGVVNNALSALSTLINGAIGGVNKLIGLINNIPGVNVGAIGDVNFKANTAAIDKISSMQARLKAPTQPTTVNLGKFNSAGDYLNNVNLPTAPEKASFGRLEYTSLGDAFSKGQQAGKDFSLKTSDKLTGAVSKVTGLLSGPNASVLTPGTVPTNGYDPTQGGTVAPGAAGKDKNPTGGKLDKIGKIEDKINIADEDLKLLLEMADSRSINAVNITLSPSVTFRDVTMKEEADVDKVIAKINKNFEDEMVRSVEGVVTT